MPEFDKHNPWVFYEDGNASPLISASSPYSTRMQGEWRLGYRRADWPANTVSDEQRELFAQETALLKDAQSAQRTVREVKEALKQIRLIQGEASPEWEQESQGTVLGHMMELYEHVIDSELSALKELADFRKEHPYR